MSDILRLSKAGRCDVCYDTERSGPSPGCVVGTALIKGCAA